MIFGRRRLIPDDVCVPVRPLSIYRIIIIGGPRAPTNHCARTATCYLPSRTHIIFYTGDIQISGLFASSALQCVYIIIYLWYYARARWRSSHDRLHQHRSDLMVNLFSPYFISLYIKWIRLNNGVSVAEHYYEFFAYSIRYLYTRHCNIIILLQYAIRSPIYSRNLSRFSCTCTV